MRPVDHSGPSRGAPDRCDLTWKRMPRTLSFARRIPRRLSLTGVRHDRNIPRHGIFPAGAHDAGKGGNDFTELSRMVTASGLMRRRYGYYWTKLIAVPIVLGALVVVFLWLGDTWWQLITAGVLAVVLTQVAMLGHDAAHRQIFRSGQWNDWTSLVIGNLFVGMSYGWWQHKHTRHHANPNKIGADPDIDLPVISFTPEQAARRRTSRGPLG